ncbi:hypothetical protein C0992_007635 [Termitomyces sp. T32_za158]|nr:hypothetical protein C0992_007635 [Termitomyces sp. T32_za158]
MAPKKVNAEPKQKSLMSWLSNDSIGTSSTIKRKAKSTMPDDASILQSSPQEPKTPESKSSNAHALNSSAMTRSNQSRGHSTPPTSDPIDVDILASDEEDHHPVQKTKQRKRKMVLMDSDEDENENDNSVSKQRKSSQPMSSPVPKASAKKQRIGMARTVDDDEDDVESALVTSFSQRLTNFKKSPVKKAGQSARKSRAHVSDDDDFLAPSDSDDDVKSIKSSASRSSASSRRSAVSSEDELSDNDSTVKSKSKSKSSTKKTPSEKQTSAAFNGGASGLFLTAAERREQGKKDEKKAAETPYSFLEDIKDASISEGRRPGEPDYDPRTISIPKSAWAEFTPFEKQFWEVGIRLPFVTSLKAHNRKDQAESLRYSEISSTYLCHDLTTALDLILPERSLKSFRKFLELYEDDARIGHQEFDLKLTSRVKMSMVTF